MARPITRPVVRDTDDRDFSYNLPLCIRLEPGSKCLYIWQKGRRRRYPIRFAEIFRQAMLAQGRLNTGLRTAGK